MSVLTMLTLSIAVVWPITPDVKATKKTKTDEPLPALRSPGDMFASSEEGIYALLNLSADQLKALRANNLAAQKSYSAIRAKFKEDGDVWAKVRAYDATATAAKAETKRIMTKEQHAKYIAMWDAIMAPYIANSQKYQGSARGLVVPKK